MRECQNQLEIIGELKSKTVKRAATKDGVPTIALDLVVSSKIAEDKINEVKVSLWAKQGSKLYSGYETIANEYKTKVDNEVGDRVKISGNIDLNEFVSKNDGTLISRPKFKGVFVNRLEADSTLVDSCGAVVECIIVNHQDEIKDGKITGRKLVKLYTVGYNDSIIELNDVVVRAELAKQFTQLYSINSTGKLFLEINNYAVVKEQEVQAAPTTVAFGSQLNVMPQESIVKDYINEIVIIGGDMPLATGGFTAQEIQEMTRIRNNKIQELTTATPAPSSTPNGFGAGFGSDLPSFDDADMPF